ncbi:hypothetical protein [Paludibacter sp.]|uniref:hypothetical protein n=1 Tax=Paludibacter sp. TaxID=1898105 RepID=UPI00135488B5|nr:hypothetical protein [Paludibacter sp.]MTK52212.1 hypothetical protein [Paludibacter sp.]
MSNKITYSSELMRNFIQAEIMSPQSKFQALQTNTGLSLLFSVGTDDVFFVTEEIQASSSGWTKIDLSSAQIAKDFANTSSVSCKTFDVAQNITNGTVGAAMVLTDTKNDFLYLCLNNSNADTQWLNSPNWVYLPFDAQKGGQPVPSSITIVNVFLSETNNGQYIVVDIERDPSSATKLVSRYYIDANKTGGYAWHVHDVSMDIEVSKYQSCVGRQYGQPIDGIYTIGSIDGTAQFLYLPLYNIWNPQLPANPMRLSLLGSLVPDAIASCRNADQSTDVFCTSGNGLYYFASKNQKDKAQGILVQQNSIFIGVTHLYAYKTSSKVVVWGLNQADQVFYTSCPVDQITNQSAWSYPVPILCNVDLVSPYINCIDGGNTFFSVSENNLIKMIQSPSSSMWTKQFITLPVPDVNTKSQNFSSYTSRIQLTDDNNQPLTGTQLLLSTASRGHFYINNLYYVLDSDPILAQTDTVGCITIIETIDDIQGSIITVADDNGNTITINPMEKPINKVTALDTSDKLQNAVITNPDGSTKNLIDSGTPKSQLDQVAQANTQLASVYTSVSGNNGTPTVLMAIPSNSFSTLKGFENSILTDVGDLFRWLESGIEHVVQLVEDTATGLWHFVVKIAGEIYQGVLDTVEKVAGAIKWIYNAIKVAIEDLLKFLEFLFQWGDITRTKNVIKNLAKVFLQREIDQVEVFKGMFDKEMQDAINTINSWAGITDWSGLGSAATSPLNASSNASVDQSAPGTLLSTHFQNNAGNINQLNPPAPVNPSQSPIDTLFLALKNEGSVLDNVLDQLSELAKDYSTLSLADVLKRIVGIIADAAIESAQNVIDALFDVIYEFASGIMAVLDTEIYIPMVSDILEYFGVPKVSFLDLFCWIAAVPVTIGYKIAKDVAPFPDDQYTKILSDSPDYQTLINSLSQSQTPETVQIMAMKNNTTVAVNKQPANNSMFSIPDSVSEAISVSLHSVSGFLTLMSCFVSSFEAAAETGENAFSTPSAVLGVLTGVSGGGADFLVPKDPIENTAVSWVSTITSGCTVLAKLIFCGPAQKKFASSSGIMKNLKAGDGRATGAIVNSILIIPALFCSCWHFYELSQDSSNDTLSAAIIDETSNLTSYISRIGYTIAVNDKEPESKAVSIGVMVVANVATSGLQTAEAIVGA